MHVGLYETSTKRIIEKAQKNLETGNTYLEVLRNFKGFMKQVVGIIPLIRDEDLKKAIEEVRVEIFTKLEDFISQENDLDILEIILYGILGVSENFEKERSDLQDLQQKVRERIVGLEGDA